MAEVTEINGSGLSSRGVGGSGTRGSGKPTVTDVAKRANVSVATVSYVLNDRLSEVSEETASRVKKAVRDLGYVKNLAAAALSGKKTKLIAVIIPEISDLSGTREINPFYGEFIFRLEHIARQKGYGICIRGGDEEDYVNFLLQRGVDTAVLVGMSEWELPTALEKNDIHCVLYDSFHDDARHSQVRTDEIKGGYLAAERLIDIQKKNIVFAGEIRADRSVDVVSMRYRGARKACEMAELNPIQHLEVKVSYEDGLRAAEKIIAMGADGIVTTADIVAVGIMEGLQNRGIKIPADIAVVGYDNLPISRITRPRLSTIDQGLSEKVQAVMSMIETREQGLIKIIAPKIVVRESA